MKTSLCHHRHRHLLLSFLLRRLVYQHITPMMKTSLCHHHHHHHHHPHQQQQQQRQQQNHSRKSQDVSSRLSPTCSAEVRCPSTLNIYMTYPTTIVVYHCTPHIIIPSEIPSLSHPFAPAFMTFLSHSHSILLLALPLTPYPPSSHPSPAHRTRYAGPHGGNLPRRQTHCSGGSNITSSSCNSRRHTCTRHTITINSSNIVIFILLIFILIILLLFFLLYFLFLFFLLRGHPARRGAAEDQGIGVAGGAYSGRGRGQ